MFGEFRAHEATFAASAVAEPTRKGVETVPSRSARHRVITTV